MIYKAEIIGYDLYINGILYTGDIKEMMCRIRLGCESKI
jgi:hypothetical protein